MARGQFRITRNALAELLEAERTHVIAGLVTGEPMGVCHFTGVHDGSLVYDQSGRCQLALGHGGDHCLRFIREAGPVHRVGVVTR